MRAQKGAAKKAGAGKRRPAVDTWTPIKLSRLLLDNDNPRHDHAESEPEAIEYLVKHEKVLKLASDIAKRGRTSPFDIVGVFPHPRREGFYVVAEGNRRVCAQKLLKDPALAPDSYQAKFSAAAKKLKAPLSDEIQVYIAPTEGDLLQWKALRHGGEQDGVGTRDWNATQKARNDTKIGRTNPDQRSVELLDFAEQAALISAEERKQLKVTTLTRHLNNEVLRDALGIASTLELQRTAPADQFASAVQKFLRDALPKRGSDGRHVQPVNSRNDKEKIKQYAAGLRTAGYAVTKQLPKPAAVEVPKPPKLRNNRSPDLRSRVVPAGFTCRIENAALRRIYEELRKLPIRGEPHYTIAATFLLRAFLELTVKAYCKKHSLGKLDQQMHVVAQLCEIHLRKDIGLISQHGANPLDRALKPWRVAVSKADSILSPDTLGAAVHGGVYLSAVDLTRIWDEMQVGIGWMLERI